MTAKIDDKIPVDLNQEIVLTTQTLRLKSLMSYKAIYDPAKSWQKNLLKLLKEEDYRRWR